MLRATMDEAFWMERWSLGQIGFHESEPNRFLSGFIDHLGDPGSVFVPLCGKSVDLDHLAERGHRVTGCELVAQAVDDYFAERGEAPTRRETPYGALLSSPSRAVSIARGDVFDFEPEGELFDALFDRAALVALDPADRPRYAQKLASLLRPGGRALLVTFEHDIGSGPPWSVPPTEVAELFGEDFEIESLASGDALAANPRFGERGATYVRERAYALTRR